MHAELFIYPGDLPDLAPGQPVQVTSIDGRRAVESEIEFLSPMIDPDSQRAIAHVEILQCGRGNGVRASVSGARIETGAFEVPLAVRTDALQRFRDFTVVYARVGDTL